MLKIYDFDTLELEYVYCKITSVSWTKNFYSPGSFTIILPRNIDGAKYLKKNKIVTYSGESGIIKYLRLTNEQIEIKGTDLKGLALQRLVIAPFVYEENPTVESGYDRIKGTEEQVIRHYANNHMIEPRDSSRKFSNLILADYHGFGNELAWQAKFTALSEELEKICIYSQLGYDIIFDDKNKKLIFDVCRGIDRTSNDSYFGLLTFSEQFKNISSAEYILDATGEKNVCYVCANGEEEKQFVYESKKEDFCSIFRNEATTTASGDDEDYADEIESQGLSFIKENSETEIIDAQINSKLEYKKDFNLGDFVTVAIQNCFGENVTLNRQITSVTQNWQYGLYTAEPTFGEKKQSVLKRIIRSV